MKKTLIVIAGPTASGKTEFSVSLARALGCPIVSADSRQFYHELRIGTAMPEPEQLAAAPHFFIGHLSIWDSYSVVHFEVEALTKLDQIFQVHDFAILVGGSGLYIDAVTKGFDEIPDTDPEVRQTLEEQFQREGIDGLRMALKRLDPELYAAIDLKNPKRILRGLEVVYSTGRRLSAFQKGEIRPRPFQTIKCCIDLPRELLHQRIQTRTGQMIEKGWIEEARELLPHRHLNALNTLGYKELFSVLDGEIDLEKGISLIERNTRRYARKQISWFRRDPAYVWFLPRPDLSPIDQLRASFHQIIQ